MTGKADFDPKILFWMGFAYLPACRTEKLKLKPAKAQLGLGSGLSLAMQSISKDSMKRLSAQSVDMVSEFRQ